VVLTISDHLPWGNFVQQHLEILRDKLNTYLAFVESGELIDQYPDAAGRKVIIDVIGKFDLGAAGVEFFQNATIAVSDAGMTLQFSRFVE
jgi:hypothetical protein